MPLLVTRALGCVVTDLRHDFVRTINKPLDTIETEVLEQMLLKQAFDGNTLIDQEPIDINEIKIEHSLDMQFIGQFLVTTVPRTCQHDVQRNFDSI